MLSVKNKKVFLFGYYGKSNIGDDIMLLNLVKLLQEKEVKKIIILVDPAFNMQSEFNGDIIFLRGIKNNIIKLTTYLLQAHIFIWGGGTCFFENPSKRGLNELFIFSRIRKLYSKKTENFFIGIGVEKLKINKSIVTKILLYTDGVIVRDSISKQNLLELYPEIKNNFKFLEVFNDLVLINSTKKLFKDSAIINSNTPYMTFSGHYKYTEDEQLIKHTANELLLTMKKLNIFHIVFLPSKYDKKGDNTFHNNLVNSFDKKVNCNLEVLELNSINEYFRVLKNSKYHIGMRLHSLILADILLIPKISLAYQQKINQYDSKAVDVFTKWSNLNFLQINKEELSNLLEKNTENYESFFK